MFQALIVLTVAGFWLVGFLIATRFGLLQGRDILVDGGVMVAGATFLSAYTRPTTKRFRGLKTNPLSPEIGETFDRWKKEWREPRMRLSDR
jgi:hypothetical protein